jgi:hypothetical protein
MGQIVGFGSGSTWAKGRGRLVHEEGLADSGGGDGGAGGVGESSSVPEELIHPVAAGVAGKDAATALPREALRQAGLAEKGTE